MSGVDGKSLEMEKEKQNPSTPLQAPPSNSS